MKNILTICILIALLLNCNKHYIREFEPTTAASKLEKPYKIALVGFYPLQYSSVTSGRVTTTTATLDYKNSTKEFFPHGKKIEDFPSSGVDSSVSPTKVKEVALRYITSVKRSGFNELSKLVEIKGEGEKAEFQLKKRDVDFYIIAIHGPAFDSSSGNLGRFLLTAHLFLLTLGTSPIWSSVPAETQFLVYDRNLNLIGDKSFENRYTKLTAWWGNEEEGNINQRASSEFTVKIFAPDVKEFSHDFPTWLKDQKAK